MIVARCALFVVVACCMVASRVMRFWCLWVLCVDCWCLLLLVVRSCCLVFVVCFCCLYYLLFGVWGLGVCGLAMFVVFCCSYLMPCVVVR